MRGKGFAPGCSFESGSNQEEAAGWGGVVKASAMSHAADINARLMALPDQLKWS